MQTSRLRLVPPGSRATVNAPAFTTCASVIAVFGSDSEASFSHAAGVCARILRDGGSRHEHDRQDQHGAHGGLLSSIGQPRPTRNASVIQ